MDNEECKVTTEKLKGKIVADVEVTDVAVVVRFEDNTYLDIYLDPKEPSLKASTNKLP
ncbi:hypothetical protein [Alkalicoccobacillus porphyridii]|uniref:hypothetical protein n=1 Tax=Alkalicoccobacillus porphyridii TaxID=2597270 RepID=UPI00163D81B4|nr:hypothetical protein [Alkalicoccobacillus porphyridii]